MSPVKSGIQECLDKNFMICFEIGYTQSDYIVDYATKHLNDINITVEKDYSNKDRFIFITNEPKS